MTRFAAATESMRGGYDAYRHLRSYALLPVLYSGALGAVARHNGRMLAAFVSDPVVNVDGRALPVPVVINPWRPFQDLDVAATVFARLGLSGGTAEEHLQALQNRKVGKLYTPLSEYLFGHLRPLAGPFVLDDDEYAGVFHRAEAFVALAELDWALTADNVPDYRKDRSHWIGRHVHTERYLGADAGLAHDLLRETQTTGQDWWPVKGGMFGGDSRRAAAAARVFVENEAEARSHRLW